MSVIYALEYDYRWDKNSEVCCSINDCDDRPAFINMFMGKAKFYCHNHIKLFRVIAESSGMPIIDNDKSYFSLSEREVPKE